MSLNITDEVNLTPFQRIKIRFHGYAQIGYAKKAGWKEKVPLFAFNCETHGVVSNTPQGHWKRLLCPRCIEEEIASSLVDDHMMLDDIRDVSLVEGN